MSHITLAIPRVVVAPRGAAWAAALFSAVLGALPHARKVSAAARESLRRNREAADLRRYASEVASTDPRFAADLFAAADRHTERD